MSTPSWDEYFLNLTDTIASRSKDPNTQVGCVIVDPNNRIVSTGYNGFPPGIKDLPERWQKGEKKKWVIHCEMNAMMFAKQNLDNCIMYLGFWPCPDCARHVVVSGIKKVICRTSYYKSDFTEQLFKEANVEIITKQP